MTTGDTTASGKSSRTLRDLADDKNHSGHFLMPFMSLGDFKSTVMGSSMSANYIHSKKGQMFCLHP